MSDFVHTLFSTDRGLEPGIRLRFESQNFIEYTLTGFDIRNWVTFSLVVLAEKFYSDGSLWWIIQDANPIKNPWGYVEGDTIIIPLDFRSAISRSTASIEALKRKVSI